MESHVNLYLELLTNLSTSGHIITYLSTMNETANLFKLLCKRTKSFWKENVEAISGVILKDEDQKLFLDFKDNFTMNRAKILLKYRTYLMYNIDINLESKKAFKAILYFLENVNKIAINFFNSITIELNKDSISLYNQFILKYIEMGFDMEAIDLKLDNFLDSYENTPQYENIPILEYYEEVSYPFDRILPFKFGGCFNICQDIVTIENLNEVKFLFQTFGACLKNSKMIYDFKYRFSDKISEFVEELYLYYNSESNDYQNSTINNIIEYYLEMFPNLKKIVFQGPGITLEKFYELSSILKLNNLC